MTFELPDSADGVLTVTVWDAGGRPLAERLVFRQPAKSVRVTVSPDTKTYSPGAKTRLSVQTTDERGVPTSAVVGLTVTDDSVLEMIDQARTAGPSTSHGLSGKRSARTRRRAHLSGSKQRQIGAGGRSAAGNPGLAAVRARRLEEIRRAAPGRRPPRAGSPGAQPCALRSRAWNARVGLDAPQEWLLRKRQTISRQAGPPVAVRVALAPQQNAGGIEGKDKEIAQAAGAAGPFAGALRDRREIAEPNDFVYTRVYAHELRPDRQPGDRVDFRETLFWHAGLKTSEQGAATVEFALNDSVTTFRVFADAFTAAGAIGSGSTSFESVNPFYLEPKLPLEVTQGDRILLPIACVNTTSSSLGQVKMTVDTEFSAIAPSLDQTVTLAASARRRTLVKLQAGPHNGPFDVKIAATAGAFSDRVVRRITVRPGGFPVEIAAGGLLDQGAVARHSIRHPARHGRRQL